MSEEAEKEATANSPACGACRSRLPVQRDQDIPDLMVSLPWRNGTSDNLDIRHARQVLDEDHYGLKEIRSASWVPGRKLR